MKNACLFSVLFAAASAFAAEGWTDCNRNGTCDPYEDPSLPVERRVEDLLARMTPEEKAGQLYQDCASDPKENFDAGQGFHAKIRDGRIGSFIWNCSAPGERNRYQRAALEETRLGIPLSFAHDVIHGCNLIFPISPALAGAFEPELFRRMQRIAAVEARAQGVDWCFAPMCDVARDVRWGRVQETCGEDPYLAALCVAEQVKGFQNGDPSSPDAVAACLKHFVGYSAGTGGRDYTATHFGEWDLRNIYLPPFRAGVDAGVATIMSSFNDIDGIPACANRHTLTDVLRGEWKWNGLVVSDWDAIGELCFWGYAANRAEAGALAMNAGNDVDMMGGAFVQAQGEGLVGEVKAGRVSAAAVDEAVRRLLRFKFRVGLFERPYVDEGRLAKVTDEAGDFRKAARVLAREAAAKACVLAKNAKETLPLDPAKLKRVALIGPMGDDGDEMIGAWFAHGRGEETVSLAAGLKAAMPDVAIDVVKGCALNTEAKTTTLQDGKAVVVSDDPSFYDAAAAVEAAKAADLVVMAVGELKGWTGENTSRAFLGLTGRQQELFDAVAESGKPIVTVLFCGRPLSVPAVWEKSAAVLYAWQPGSEAGNALADVLLGKVDPSGRFSMSVPRDRGQCPIFYNHATGSRPWDGHYRDLPRKPAYPFGYGLTYTTFAYTNPKVTRRADGTLEATAKVTNTGKRAGTEVVQLYINQLACRGGWRPRRELRGFERITLQPGESREVVFALDEKRLGYVKRDGQFACDHGEYKFWIAPDSVSGDEVLFNY